MKVNLSLLYAPVGEVTSAGGETAGASSTTTSDNVWADHNPDAPASTETPAASPAVQTSPAATGTPAATTPPAAQTQPGAQTPPVAPAQAQLTPAQIADIAAQAAQRVGQQQAPQQPAQQPQGMSQAEFNKTFNVIQLDAAGFTGIMGYAPDSPKQVEALNNFAQGVVRQALTMAQVKIEAVTRDLESRFGAQVAPITAEREAQVGAALQTEFFTTHPQLKAAEPLVLEVANRVKASGRKFETKEAAFNFVAEETRRLLPTGYQPPTTGMNPPTNTQQPVTRQMTPTSVGGQVSASTGFATSRVNDAKSIFG